MPKPDISRQEVKKQPAEIRRHNFDEVALGFTEEQARIEASRCIQCPKPFCVDGCPVGIDIPGFIKEIREGNFKRSFEILHDRNLLPAICGRVCPQEDQCEKLCILGKRKQPVNIGKLERFVADWAQEHSAEGSAITSHSERSEESRIVKEPDVSPESVLERSEGVQRDRAGIGPTISNPVIPGTNVAVIGSGPGGLTCASELAKLGYRVTIFEGLHKPGGVLIYGIPEFRLPKKVVEKEINALEKLGVEIRTNVLVGRTVTIDELFDRGYKAVFIASGAGLPKFLGIPGENLSGVYSANEFLTRSNLMKAYLFPRSDTPIIRGKRVAVVGGGNVAMDSARTALRLGAQKVYDVYRRSRVEMPARNEEIENAIEEGVELMFLALPIRVVGDENGWVRGLICQRMELGEPDESGRRRPVPIPDSEFELQVDVLVVAISTGANPLIMQTTPGLKTNKWGYIIADADTGATSHPGIFAGGDIVSGSATVILAMGTGRRAASTIHRYIQSGAKSWPPEKE